MMMTPKSTGLDKGAAARPKAESKAKLESKTVKKTHEPTRDELLRQQNEIAKKLKAREAEDLKAQRMKLRERARRSAEERNKHKTGDRYAMVSPAKPTQTMRRVSVRDFGDVQPYTWYLLNEKQWRRLVAICRTPAIDLSLLPAGMKPAEMKVVDATKG